MHETFQIIIAIISGTILLISLVVFVVFSTLQYRRAKKIHEYEKEQLKIKFDKEVLNVELEVKEATLQFVSEEIHDNVGQLLSLIKMNLYQLSKETDAKRVDEISQLVSDAMKSLREISHMLSQNSLDGNNLIELINRQVVAINRIGKFDSSFTTDLDEPPKIDSQTILVLFRMLQELINNSLKYSEANSLSISLREDSKHYELIVQDDGVGFDLDEKSVKGNGLQNLYRRAEIIDADLQIWSEENQGVKTKIIILKRE